MSDNPISGRPDRANPDDPDEIDVPTYRERRRPPRRKKPLDPYKKAGKAAPQVILPRQEVEEPTGETQSAPSDLRQDSQSTEDSTAGQAELHTRDTEVKPIPTAALGESTMLLGESAPVNREPGRGVGERVAPTAPVAANTASVSTTAMTDIAEDPDDEPVSAGVDRRGTLNLGLFLLRLVTGAFFIIQSVGLFFTLGATNGLNGLVAQYTEQGFHLPNLLSVAVPAATLAVGVFLILGLITPLFAALGLVVSGFQVLTSLRESVAGLNVFAWDAHLWLPMMLVVITATLIFTGPGTWGLDYSRSWARRPLASAWIFVLVAIVILCGVWWLCAGVNPLHSA